MKKYKKISIVITLMLCLIMSSCYAVDQYFTGHEINIDTDGNVKNFANTAINYLTFAGYAIAIGMIAFIGIKYIIASADERATMKGTLVKVVVGACIVALASTLVNFAINVLET